MLIGLIVNYKLQAILLVRLIEVISAHKGIIFNIKSQ